MERRADWKAVHESIRYYILRNLARVKKVEDKEKRWAVNIPKIAKDLDIKSKQTVREHLSEMFGREIDGVPVSAEVDGVEIIIRDDPADTPGLRSSGEELDEKETEPVAKPLLGQGALARGASVAETGMGAFLLRDSWEREGPAKAMELIAGSLLVFDGLGRVITGKGPLDHAFEILNNFLKSPE